MSGCQHQEDALQRKRVAQVVVIGTRAHARFRWRAYSTPNMLRQYNHRDHSRTFRATT